MRLRAGFLIAFLSLSFPTASLGRDIWAKHSETLRETDETIDWVLSTDNVRIHSDANSGQLIAHGKVIDVREMMNPGLTEVNWSKDAGALFINSSDGGEVGTWSTRVFAITGSEVREVRVGEAVSKEAFPSDTPREYLNVMSVGWIEHGAALLALRQVPNSSSYGEDMDLARLYVVDLGSSRVIERLTPAEAARKYRSVLGPGTEEALSQSSIDVTLRR